MNKLLQEIDELIQEREDSKKEFEQSDNWCHPAIQPMTKKEFDIKIRERINAYVRRLAQQAYEGI